MAEKRATRRTSSTASSPSSIASLQKSSASIRRQSVEKTPAATHEHSKRKRMVLDDETATKLAEEEEGSSTKSYEVAQPEHDQLAMRNNKKRKIANILPPESIVEIVDQEKFNESLRKLFDILIEKDEYNLLAQATSSPPRRSTRSQLLPSTTVEEVQKKIDKGQYNMVKEFEDDYAYLYSHLFTSAPANSINHSQANTFLTNGLHLIRTEFMRLVTQGKVLRRVETKLEEEEPFTEEEQKDEQKDEQEEQKEEQKEEPPKKRGRGRPKKGEGRKEEYVEKVATMEEIDDLILTSRDETKVALFTKTQDGYLFTSTQKSHVFANKMQELPPNVNKVSIIPITSLDPDDVPPIRHAAPMIVKPAKRRPMYGDRPAIPIRFLNYGPFSTFCPTVDSYYSNISYEDTIGIYEMKKRKAFARMKDPLELEIIQQQDGNEAHSPITDTALSRSDSSNHIPMEGDVEMSDRWKSEDESPAVITENGVSVSKGKERATNSISNAVDANSEFKSASTVIDFEWLKEHGIDAESILQSLEEHEPSKATEAPEDKLPAGFEVDDKLFLEALEANKELLLQLVKLQEQRFDIGAKTGVLGKVTREEIDIAKTLEQRLAHLTSKVPPNLLTSPSAIQKVMARLPYKEAAFKGVLPPNRVFAFASNAMRPEDFPQTATMVSTNSVHNRSALGPVTANGPPANLPVMTAGQPRGPVNYPGTVGFGGAAVSSHVGYQYSTSHQSQPTTPQKHSNTYSQPYQSFPQQSYSTAPYTPQSYSQQRYSQQGYVQPPYSPYQQSRHSNSAQPQMNDSSRGHQHTSPIAADTSKDQSNSPNSRTNWRISDEGCANCGTTIAPEWRNYQGLKLCNKCGLHYKKSGFTQHRQVTPPNISRLTSSR